MCLYCNLYVVMEYLARARPNIMVRVWTQIERPIVGIYYTQDYIGLRYKNVPDIVMPFSLAVLFGVILVCSVCNFAVRLFTGLWYA